MSHMEHRCGTRHAVEGTVTLQPHGAPALTARLIEASISGMFVEMTTMPFCCNSVVDVEMTLPGEAGLRTYRWQAMVIRKTASGAGLMFDRLRPPAISRLMASAAAGLPLPVHATVPSSVTFAPPLPPSTPFPPPVALRCVVTHPT